MKDLDKLYRQCLEELETIQIKPERITAVYSKKGTPSTWGTCYYNRRADNFRIKINERLLEDDTKEEQVKGTIIHEILHAVTGCCGHKGEWIELANKVRAELGYDITRCTSAEKFGLKRDELDWKYVIVCDKCKNKYYHNRKTGVVKSPWRYHCSCGGTLTVYPSKIYRIKFGQKQEEKQPVKTEGKELKFEQTTLF